MEQSNDTRYVDNDFKDMTLKAGKKSKANFDMELDIQAELNKIQIPGSNKKVIFVQGDKELLYENGEFYIRKVTDPRDSKNKMTRKDATEMYLEFMRRQGSITRRVYKAKDTEEKDVAQVVPSQDRSKPEKIVATNDDDIIR